MVRKCVRYRVDSKLRASVIVRFLHEASEGHGLGLVQFIHMTGAGGGRLRGMVGGERRGEGLGLTVNKYSLLLKRNGCGRGEGEEERVDTLAWGMMHIYYLNTHS